MNPLLQIPDWLKHEMTSLGYIEPLLFEHIENLPNVYKVNPGHWPARNVVFDLCERLRFYAPDIVFLAPWLKRGGSDLELIYFVEALNSLGVRCAVITSTTEESTWLHMLPDEVMVYEFGRWSHGLYEGEKVNVLLQALLNSAVLAIHIMNCHYSWEMLKSHGKALRQAGIRIFASLYCDDVSKDGVAVGYATSPFPDSAKWLDALTTDNFRFAESISWRTGYPRSRIFPLYYPYPEMPPEVIEIQSGESSIPSILWASRITLGQKIPSVLLDIICALPEFNFHVYGEVDSTMSEKFIHTLSSQANCYMYGKYDGFTEIAGARKYDVFLYTSAWDGLPNVVSEAVAAGIPVVAPDVGGISEVIHSQTGFLVSDFTNVQEYIDRLLEAVSDKDSAKQRALNAMSLLHERHNRIRFVESICQIPNYPVVSGS